MTSNLGSDMRDFEQKKRPVGFGSEQNELSEKNDITDKIESAARAELPAELWNRIDEPLVFAPLTSKEVAQIAGLMLTGLGRRLEKERKIALDADEKVINHLVDSGGFDATLGARPMRRTISRLIEGPVARLILETDSAMKAIKIRCSDGGLKFEPVKKNTGFHVAKG
jgi:ATP-dependent Clp protease ATP-binding subunit ClpC